MFSKRFRLFSGLLASLGDPALVQILGEIPKRRQLLDCVICWRRWKSIFPRGEMGTFSLREEKGDERRD